MLRVAAGDKRAFAALFDRYQGSVAHFAFRFVGEKGRAEELAQDIFVKLYKNAKSYRPTAKFKTFLFRVASNHCLNEVRKHEYRLVDPLEDEEGQPSPHPSSGPTPEEALWGRQLERAIQKALAQISERERAAFAMCRFEGMAYKDIAFALSASESAVKSLIHRATLAVAQCIEDARRAA